MRPQNCVRNMYRPYVSCENSSRRNTNISIKNVEQAENINKYETEYTKYRQVFGSLFQQPNKRRRNTIFDTQRSALKFMFGIVRSSLVLEWTELNVVAIAHRYIDSKKISSNWFHRKHINSLLKALFDDKPCRKCRKHCRLICERSIVLNSFHLICLSICGDHPTTYKLNHAA